jgi:hypothetical protein
MKVKELIAELTFCDLDKEVFIWVDGNRYPISIVDFNMDDCVDINAEIE